MRQKTRLRQLLEHVREEMGCEFAGELEVEISRTEQRAADAAEHATRYWRDSYH